MRVLQVGVSLPNNASFKVTAKRAVITALFAYYIIVILRLFLSVNF